MRLTSQGYADKSLFVCQTEDQTLCLSNPVSLCSVCKLQPGKMRAVLYNYTRSGLRKLVTDVSASSFSFRSMSRHLTTIRHAENIELH